MSTFRGSNGGTIHPGARSPGQHSGLGIRARAGYSGIGATHSDIGATHSDIGLADPARYPVASVDPCSGGRCRLPRPAALTAFGTVVPASPERRVGFVFGVLIGRVKA